MAGMSGSIMMARKYSWEWEILEMERENECLQLQYYYEETSSSPTRGCSGFNNNNNNGGFNMMNQVLLDYKMISEEDQELFEINIKDKERPNLETIREDCEEEESSTVFSLDFHVHDYHKDVVYVAVGDYSSSSSSSSSSMEALSWALKHAITPSTTLCLLHVFPQLNFIPTPMGKIPRTHVNAEHVNVYLTLEKAKRKLLLQKFIDLCVASKVKVETVLIEGDSVAKAIVDLVGNLNIRKLVIGTTQYSNRRRGGSKRKNAIAKMVLKNLEEKSCDIKIICEGREVIDQMININIGGDHHLTSPRSSSSSSSSSVSSNLPDHHHQSRPAGIVPLKRTFITNPLWLLFMPTFLSPRSIE